MQNQGRRLLGNDGCGGHGPHRKDLVKEFGFDTKFAMHLLRLGIQGVELMKTGRLTLPLADVDREFLMNVRAGKVRLDTVLMMAEKLEEQMLEAGDRLSALPDEPDYAAVEAFMLKCYIRKWACDRTTMDIKEDHERLESLRRP